MFIPDGDGVVVATTLTQGPWNPNAQYGGAPAALLTWAVEQVPTLVPMRIGRITIDMHRPVPLERLRWEASVVRQGKRLQVVVATLADDRGVEVARATALRLRLGAGPSQFWDPRRPVPDPLPFGSPRSRHRPANPDLNGFTAGLESRDAGEAPGAGWYRAAVPVVAGTEVSPTVLLVWASDFTANSGNHLDQTRWSAINPDLTIHLARQPAGDWTGVATRAWYAEDGIGHSRADLYDLEGFVGTCTCSLLADETAAPFLR